MYLRSKLNQNAHITLQAGKGKLQLSLPGKNSVTGLKTLGDNVTAYW